MQQPRLGIWLQEGTQPLPLCVPVVSPTTAAHLPEGMHWKIARWPTTTVTSCGFDRRGEKGGEDPAEHRCTQEREKKREGGGERDFNLLSPLMTHFT